MKIEKLTENKIRIILKKTDFKDKGININQLLLTTTESQKLFLEILNRAEKELNFDTTGYKLLIDAIIENDNIFIFTMAALCVIVYLYRLIMGNNDIVVFQPENNILFRIIRKFHT